MLRFGRVMPNCFHPFGQLFDPNGKLLQHKGSSLGFGGQYPSGQLCHQQSVVYPLKPSSHFL